MKKKLLLLTVLVIALTCIFAISVSAAEPNNDGEKITLTTGQTVALYDTDGDPLCWYYDDTNTLTYIKATSLWYENGSTKLYSVWTQPNKQGLCLQTCDNTTVNKIVVADFRHLEFTTIDKDNLFKNSKVVEYVRLPDTLTEIMGYFFNECDNLQRVYIPETSEDLIHIGNRAFYGCKKLYALYLPKNLVSLNDSGRVTPFQNCENLYFVDDPDDLTKKQVYYFPTTLSTLYGETFDTCKNLNDVLVFGENLKVIDNNWAFENAQNGEGAYPKVVFLGDMTTVSCSTWNVSAIYFCNKNDVDATSVGLSGSKTIYYCNAADNTNHLYLKQVSTPATCTTPGVTGLTCFCGLPKEGSSTTTPALGHTASEIIKNKYFSENEDGSYNYFANMKKVCDCTVCDAKDVEFDYEGTALFATDKGYSFSENDKSSFSYTLHVNVDAIKNYLAENPGFKYGVVVSADTANKAPISIVDGAVNKNVAQTIIVELQGSTNVYEYVMTKLTFDADNQGKSLICQAYAVNGTDNKVSYLGTDKTTINAEVISHAILVKNYQSKEDLANPAA